MNRLIVLALVAGLAGCVTIEKVEKGDRAVGERLQVVIEGPWNRAPATGPAEIWTMEGLPVDQLILYSGLKDGQPIHSGGGSGKSFVFKSSMPPDEIVALFEGMFTRDGSHFRLTRLEPVDFAGQKGFRFEYALTRRSTNVQLSGLGYGTVAKGELFAILYMAPRLVFFARHRDNVERIARSAHLKP